MDILAYYWAGSSSAIATSAPHSTTIITDKWAWVIVGRNSYYISHASIVDRLGATIDLLASAITPSLVEVSTFKAAIITVEYFDLNR